MDDETGRGRQAGGPFEDIQTPGAAIGRKRKTKGKCKTAIDDPTVLLHA